jgi:hypothetical protein
MERARGVRKGERGRREKSGGGKQGQIGTAEEAREEHETYVSSETGKLVFHLLEVEDLPTSLSGDIFPRFR